MLILTDDLKLLARRKTCNIQIASCSEVVPSSCSYRWIDILTEETICEGRDIDLKPYNGKPYKFQCQMICPVQEKKCAFDVDLVFCKGAFLNIVLLNNNIRSALKVSSTLNNSETL